MSKPVKQLCYRAVAALGSCKGERHPAPLMSELYLLPFTPDMRDAFTPRERRDWLLLMVERGIRIRAPFEHLLQVDDERLQGNDELEDDELAFLREAERLKPYA
jgi:hypothetical protein